MMSSIASIASLNLVSAQTTTQFGVNSPTSALASCQFPITVTAQDSLSNTATDYSGTVNFTCSDPKAILPANLSSLTNGVGTFNVTLESVGSQIITVTDSANTAITGTSGSVAVAPIHFIFEFLTSPINQGCIAQYLVVAKDSSNITVTTYGGILNFTSSDTNAVLPYGAPTLTNGIAAFSAYFGSAGSQTITVTDSLNGATASQSNPVNVIATHLSMTVSNTTINAGSQITVNVIALDSSNNNLTAYTTQNAYGASLKINSTDTQANYTANAKCKLINGTGTFSITLNTAGSQTITVTDSNFPAITLTSSSITVIPIANVTPSESPNASPTETPTVTPTAITPTSTPSPTTSTLPTESPTSTPKPNDNGLSLTVILAIVVVVVVVVAVLGFLLFRRSRNPKTQP